jgi:hypothetical protein
MLNKIRTLQYQFDELGTIKEARVSFNDYNNNPDGNLNYTLTNEDIDLSTLSPSEIRTIAKEKILEELAKETEEEVE